MASTILVMRHSFLFRLLSLSERPVVPMGLRDELAAAVCWRILCSDLQQRTRDLLAHSHWMGMQLARRSRKQ